MCDPLGNEVNVVTDVSKLPTTRFKDRSPTKGAASDHLTIVTRRNYEENCVGKENRRYRVL